MTDWLEDDALADQYEDSSNLAARQVVHARFSTAEQSRHEWLFDQFDLPADADVLSLGAGQGVLWATNADRIPAGWDVTVTDAFQGMVFDAMETLEEVDREFHFDVVDACDIPYPEDSFDAVTANHVLSHLDDADRETALAETRRVLRPGGVCYASTNGEANLRELFGVAGEFGELPDTLAFSLENGGDQFRGAFDDVELRRFDDELRVTAPEPLVAYALSLPGYEPSDAHELGRAFRERVGDDAMRVTRDVGVFVAR
ncbi:MerR family transcriptional regulator [Halobacterium sp. DL1]|jgi:SAM-dependent methyltransferase|nr:MerR family transcriptional regulator [Halobacterium sp. DL1]